MHTAVLEDDERCMDARQLLLLTTPAELPMPMEAMTRKCV
ncbi:hypothetical protein Vi05172_g7924 [Venturia inaequalis]|nr:hypothetical protein Vi05172_g7924 [Venturia inaequalis]